MSSLTIPNTTKANVWLPPSQTAVGIEEFVFYLKHCHQIDLTGYKRATLIRRISTRMNQLGLEQYQDYCNYLQQHSEEATHCLNTILINFTGFFRDRSVWHCLSEQIIPQILASKASQEPIRVWSAGCASGEEAYTLAMLLIEKLGVDQFRQRVRIYGTDIDEAALEQARQGHYPQSEIAEIPPVLLDRYFHITDEGYSWRKDLRQSIYFCRHNLTQMPPFTKIDLLVCRNTLMYFNPEPQVRALVRFHFSLRDTGFLMLGKAERPTAYEQVNLFSSVDFSTKIFAKVPQAHRNSKLLSLAFRTNPI